jgi:hypothetical protein
MLEQCMLDMCGDMENAVDQYVKLFGIVFFFKVSKWPVFASSDSKQLLLFGQVKFYPILTEL